MITPNDFTSFFNPLLIMLMIGGIIGTFFAVRYGRQTSLTKFQEDTNKALTDRIKVLEDKIIDLEKDKIRYEHIIDTITSALRKRGLVISVDGEMYPILTDTSETAAQRKRRTTVTQQLATGTKKEDS